MPHHDDIGARFDQGGRGHGLPVDGPLAPIAPGGRHPFTRPRLFGAPGLFTGGDDHRLLGHAIALEGRQPQTLHHAVAIFDAIAQRAGGRIGDDAIHGHAHVVNEDIQLLREVDIHGCLRSHQMAVCQGRGDDRAVVLVFAWPQHQPFAGPFLGHGDLHLVIQLCLAGAEHDDRQAGRVEHRAHSGAGLRSRHALTRTVGRRKLEHDRIGVSGLGGLHPGRQIAQRGAPGLHQRRRPLFGRIGGAHLDGDARTMRRLTLEPQEGQRALATDDHAVAARTAFGSRRAERDRANTS